MVEFESPPTSESEKKWRSNFRRLFSFIDRESIVDVFDEIELGLKGLVYPYQKGEHILDHLYHRFSGLLEIIGYPSLGRHEKFLIKKLKESLKKSQNNRVLLCGAMSPLSIAQALDFMSKTGYVNGELTIVDVNPASYESAKKTLQRIASRSGIKINFFREDIRKLKPDKNPYGAIIAD